MSGRDDKEKAPAEAGAAENAPGWLAAAMKRKRRVGGGRKKGARSTLKDNEVVDNAKRDKALQKLCYVVETRHATTEAELDAAVARFANGVGVTTQTLRKDLREQYPAWIKPGPGGKPRRFDLTLAREILAGPPEGWLAPPWREGPAAVPAAVPKAYTEWLDELARMGGINKRPK